MRRQIHVVFLLFILVLSMAQSARAQDEKKWELSIGLAGGQSEVHGVGVGFLEANIRFKREFMQDVYFHAKSFLHTEDDSFGPSGQMGRPDPYDWDEAGGLLGIGWRHAAFDGRWKADALYGIGTSWREWVNSHFSLLHEGSFQMSLNLADVSNWSEELTKGWFGLFLRVQGWVSTAHDSECFAGACAVGIELSGGSLPGWLGISVAGTFAARDYQVADNAVEVRRIEAEAGGEIGISFGDRFRVWGGVTYPLRTSLRVQAREADVSIEEQSSSLEGNWAFSSGLEVSF